MTREEAASKLPATSGTEISVSRGLAGWLRSHRTSLAFTSYQTGQLFLVGVGADGAVSFNQQSFVRAMGLFHQPGRLYLASQFQVWRLENILRPGEMADNAFDAVFTPRNAQTTGDIDIHELAVDHEGKVVFANTRYSCLATLDLVHSFRPIWRPSFISRLAPEDRCHLNGLAMAQGEPRYVTAVSRSDLLNGWRDRRADGGVLIDVRSGDVVAEGLSMPHSPRLSDGVLWVLDSGRGHVLRIDPQTGRREEVAFCPGFLRGLAHHDGYGVVTVSKPRDGAFSGLDLQETLRAKDGEPWCGVLIVDITRGDVVEWIRLEGEITELFDVAAIPDVACPMSLGVATLEIHNTVTFQDSLTP